MKKIKIVYAIEYFERELFLLKISGKFLMVYKSSGLNGSVPGTVYPFMFLNDRKKLTLSDIRSGIVPGYIYKEMLYNGHFKEHTKKFYCDKGIGEPIEDAQLTKFLQYLTQELAHIEVPESNFDINDVANVAAKINCHMKSFLKEPKLIDNFLDLYLDIKYLE